MRAKSMALLMLALGCGLVASIGITQVMAKRNSEPSGPAGDTVPIFVANKDIPLGESLSSAVLRQESWPKGKVPAGALSKIEDVEGRRIRQKLYDGEPILENKLLSKGASSQGASAVIPLGYRVVSVQVDSVSGSGLILPGDRVDVLVYLVGNTQHDIRETSTRTVLQDIKVFAVNDVVELDKDGKDKSIVAKTISLLVTPAQAAKVTLACEMGKIRLVMRGPDDNAHAEDASAKPEELLGLSAFADRNKESADQKKTDNKSGMLDLWNQMKANATAKQAPQPPSTISWTMRILQPPERPNDVVMQRNNTAAAENPSLGQWRIISDDNTKNSGGSKTDTDQTGSGNSEKIPPTSDASPAATPIASPPEPDAANASDHKKNSSNSRTE
ncbi:MAG: Flp pilus assembly protein CpaB [Thermoguttaceae bacterium]|jgi:pilus assembly protein CpaB